MTIKSKKAATAKKIVSVPRKAVSRPFWALCFFFLTICSFVAIWDFDIEQSRQYTTEPSTNLVGVLGAEISFWAFYSIGIATWLVPVYLFWIGVRFATQQQQYPANRCSRKFPTPA